MAKKILTAPQLDSIDDETVAYLHLIRNDPVAFCKFCIGFEPHRKQTEFLQIPFDNTRIMLPWGRGFGKTQITAVRVAWEIFRQPKFRAFLFSPSGEQTRLLFEKVIELYETTQLDELCDWSAKGNTLKVGGRKWGSFVELVKIGLTGELGRGRHTGGKGCIVYDELNAFKYPEQVTSVLAPLIATGGGEVYLSSPGDPVPENFMYQSYLDFKEQESIARQKHEKIRHRVIECTWEDTYQLKKEFVDEQRRSLTKQGKEWVFRREFLGEWVMPQGTFFSSADIMNCVNPAIGPINDQYQTYVWSMDPGGRKSPAVIMVGRVNQASEQIEVIETRAFVFEQNKYHDNSGYEEIGEYEELVDCCLSMRKRYPPTKFYVDPMTEKSLTERLKNQFKFPVVDCRIASYPQKIVFLRELERALAERGLAWNDNRITTQLLEFSPQKNDATGKYEFPDAGYDFIVCLGMLQRWWGENHGVAFAIETTGERKWR